MMYPGNLKSYLKFFVLLLFVCTNNVQSHFTKYEKLIKNVNIIEKLQLLDPEVVLKNYQNTILSENRKIKSGCEHDLLIYYQALTKRDLWALKMLDSSSKIPTGIFEGNSVDFGAFSECLEVRGEFMETEIQGRHCMYTIGFNFNDSESYINIFINPLRSICVPHTCTSKDIIDLVYRTINITDKLKSSIITIDPVNCTNNESKPFEKVFLIVIILTVIYFCFLIFCTIYDLKHRNIYPKNYEQNPIFTSFSLVKNAANLFKFDAKENELQFIHGIRALCAILIVIIHNFILQIFVHNNNWLYIFKEWLSVPFIFGLIAMYSVDTFFILSGFFTAKSFFSKMEKKKKISILEYYLSRIIRMNFPLIGVFIYNFLLENIGVSGPYYWKLEKFLVNSCRSKIWSFFLSLQNFVEPDNFCMFHLWYIAIDVQLFWISLLILFPLYKKPKIGIMIIASLILVSMMSSGIILHMNNYPAIYFSTNLTINNVEKSVKDIYTMPYTRASPWAYGILLGYITTYKNIKLREITNYIGWILSILAFVFCIGFAHLFKSSNYQYNPTWETLYTIFERPLWSMSICWFIYACIQKIAEPISKFLSSKFFVVISRLSYCIYITHVLLPIFRIMVLTAPRELYYYNMIHEIISDLVLSFLVAIMFYLIFEKPCQLLRIMIFDIHKIKGNEETKKIKQK